MQLREIQEILAAELITGEEQLDEIVEYGYGCDLMSDVLAYVKNDVVLLTGLMHVQVIRTAEMLDIKAIVFVRGKTPDAEMIAMANRKNITLMATRHTLFTACGMLYQKGLLGEEILEDEISL